MTEEQKKLVEDNHKLIYAYLYQKDLDEEEYYDLAAIGLCKAAKKFDPNKGYKFSTLAYKSMQNEILNGMRLEKLKRCIPKNKLVYYNSETIFSESSEEYINFLPSKENIEDDAIFSVFFEWICSKCKKERDVEILRFLMEGYTHKEIGDIFNISRQTIGKIRDEIRDKYLFYSKKCKK